MIPNRYISERMSGFKLGQEDDEARAARILLETAGNTQPIVRATPSAEARVVKIRRGSEIKPQAISWIWPGWLPAGKLTILAGAAGTGKTTLALALAAVLTAGGNWPDGTRSNGTGNVLIWSSEDVADDTLVPRLIEVYCQ